MAKHPNGYRGDGGRPYVRKSALIREHARRLIAEGGRVTHAAIIEMLDGERPGHRTFPTEISRALKGIDRKFRRRKGQSVEVDGELLPSIRDAARAKGISMEAARKRLASPNFPDWKRVD
jgi:hypothetical protein